MLKILSAKNSFSAHRYHHFHLNPIMAKTSQKKDIPYKIAQKPVK